MNTRHPQTWQARWPRAGGCEHDTCLRAYSSILVRRTSSCCSDSKPCGSSRHAGDTDMHDNVRMQSRLGCAAAGAGGDDAGSQPHHATSDLDFAFKRSDGAQQVALFLRPRQAVRLISEQQTKRREFQRTRVSVDTPHTRGDLDSNRQLFEGLARQAQTRRLT